MKVKIVWSTLDGIFFMGAIFPTPEPKQVLKMLGELKGGLFRAFSADFGFGSSNHKHWIALPYRSEEDTFLRSIRLEIIKYLIKSGVMSYCYEVELEEGDEKTAIATLLLRVSNIDLEVSLAIDDLKKTRAKFANKDIQKIRMSLEQTLEQ